MSKVAEAPSQKSFMNLLASGYKQEVLEELLEKPDYLFTVNEMVEEVSGSYNSVNNFLRELEEFGIVSFQKKGRAYLVQYNQESRYHEVIKTLLWADNTPLEEAAEKWAEEFYEDSKLEGEIRAIILFGSVARGTAGPNSDIDVLILTEQESDVEKIKEKARNEARRMNVDFELVPVVESVEEFRNNLAHGKRFESNVEKNGIVLEGGELEFEN